MDLVEPFTFQAGRCMLAVIFLLVVQLIREPKNFFHTWTQPEIWKAGIPCGIALFVASGLQQIGIVDTDAGKAGFLTALYIVLVPLVGLFFHSRPPKTAWFSMIIAVIGLYLLSCAGVSQINTGDLLLIGSALAFAFQIVLVGHLGSHVNSIALNCIQSLVSGLLSLVAMFLWEQPQMDAVINCWLPIGYAGILSSGVAYTLQILGQKHLPSAPASLIMSLESVFAALTGWLLLHETMRPVEMVGAALMFAAVILSQIPLPQKSTV